MFLLLLTLLLLPCSAVFTMDQKFHNRIQDQIDVVEALCEIGKTQPRQQRPLTKNVAWTLFEVPAHVSTQEIRDRIEGNFDEIKADEIKASDNFLLAPSQQIQLPQINNFDESDSEIVELHNLWLRIQPQQSNLRPINFDESDSEMSELHKRLMLQKKLQR
jgi:hypothetical protein